MDLDASLAETTARLVQRFGDRLEPAVIESVVRRSASDLSDARIVNYVPLFVERRSVSQLTEMVRSPRRPERPGEMMAS